MQEADKKAWIVERFEATDTVTSRIENYYHENLNSGNVPAKIDIASHATLRFSVTQ